MYDKRVIASRLSSLAKLLSGCYVMLLRNSLYIHHYAVLQTTSEARTNTSHSDTLSFDEKVATLSRTATETQKFGRAAEACRKVE